VALGIDNSNTIIIKNVIMKLPDFKTEEEEIKFWQKKEASHITPI
jgi:hypothetical protein